VVGVESQGKHGEDVEHAERRTVGEKQLAEGEELKSNIL
jgi:hypothetical protein